MNAFGDQQSAFSEILKKQLKKIYLKDVPAWFSLILVAHRVQLRGVCRESPSW
jgi:hypothetical protein